MSKSVSRCGMDCGACPWGPHPRKNMSAEEFYRYRDDVKRVLGYMPIKTPCAICQTPDAEIPRGAKLPSRNCLIRQCASKTGVTNCAYCSRFPCDTAKATSGAWDRKKIEEKLGAPISNKEYHMYVEPFEGLRRLQAIRASLKPEQIVDPAKSSSLESKIVGFPENLPYAPGDIESFRAVHKLLAAIKRSSLGFTNSDTFAQSHKLESRRAHVLRFLWILGRFGKYEDSSLAVDAATFQANRNNEKALAIWSFLRDAVFNVLSEFGVCCERIVQTGVREEDLTTGTGYLRNKGWNVKMSFDKRAGGFAAMKALQTYTRKFDTKSGKKAFQDFSDVNMQILIKN